MSKLLTPYQVTEHHGSTRAEIYVEIPGQYRQDPINLRIISHLITDYNLEVNIVTAVSGNNGHTSGWFRLALAGAEESIQDALIYLSELKVIILNAEFDGW